MTILVTPGEKSLIAEFASAGIDITIEPLLCGDLHIQNAAGQTEYIIERKARGDLDASIKDGRYKEQKVRLFETGLPPDRIVYVIENLPAGSPPRVWGAICNMQHRDKVRVFQTRSAAETVQFVSGLAQSLAKFPSGEQQEPIVVNIRKKQVTPEGWVANALALIPGMSLEIAQTITAEYPTIAALQAEFAENGPGAIAELRHGASSRRIGKLAQTVQEYLANA